MLSERRAGELRTVGESFCLRLCGNLWSEIFDVHKQGLLGGCGGSLFKFYEICFTSSTLSRLTKPTLSPSISPSASIHRFCSSLVCYRSNFFYYRNYKSETVDCLFHAFWYICSTTSSRRPLFKNFDLKYCAFVEGDGKKSCVTLNWHFWIHCVSCERAKSSFCSFRSFLMKTKHWTIIEAVLCCNKRKISKNTRENSWRRLKGEKI